MQNVAVHTTGQKGNENMELIISASILLLHKYYLNSKGKLTDKGKFYSIPTKESLLSWCAERGISLSIQDFE